MSSVHRLWEAPAALLGELHRLYRLEPLTHLYALYDTVYGAERTDGVLVTDGGRLAGYIVAYHGWSGLLVHAWNAMPEHLEHLLDILGEPPGRIVLQLHGESTRHAHGFAEALRSHGYRVEAETYLDMAVTSPSSLRPREPPPGTTLREVTSENMNDLLELEAERGRPPEEAKQLLREATCIIAYADDTPASTACIYLRTRDAWLIGNVYTRPRYRRRGLAAAAATALTRRALGCKATPLLHVEQHNQAAIRLYQGIGYQVLRARPWLVASRAGGLGAPRP